MSKKYIFLMLLVAILTLSAVSASENMTDFDNIHQDEILSQDEEVDLICENEPSVRNDYDSILSANEYLQSSANNKSFILTGNDVKGYKSYYSYYQVKLTDENNTPVTYKQVKLSINGKTYNKTTNINGNAFLDLDTLPVGHYTVTTEYNGFSTQNNIDICSIKIVSKNIHVKYGTKAKYELKLIDNLKAPVTNFNVKITIGKKVHDVKTNSKGIATVILNYASGKYKIHYAIKGVSGNNNYVVKNRVSLTVLKWGNKGNVGSVHIIKNNMPNNVWVKKAVAATKKGLPLLKFSGGKGKTVFMTAGVHGNEISSQVAAMKLIKYLTKHPIKGTVYLIPFVNVKAITHKVRFTDVDYNRVANRHGTISNKIVKLVSKYDCDYYGDFHTTQPHGVPGKNVVMCSKTPNLKSYKLGKYISKKCGVSKIVYSYAGEVYPGAIDDNVNKIGIPAVLTEVMLPHNTVTKKTVDLSFAMMKSLLKYTSVIHG